MRTTTAFSTVRRRLVLALLALAIGGMSALGANEVAAGRNGAHNVNDSGG
jgi:hypothetical protein